MYKVLILIPSPLAVKNFLQDTLEKLVKDGFEVHVACEKVEDFREESSIFTYHYISIDRKLSLYRTLKARSQINKIINRIRPEVVHAHFSSAAFLLSIARNRKLSFCIATIQGLKYNAESNKLRRWLFRFFEIYALSRMNKAYVLTNDDYNSLKNDVTQVSVQLAKGFGVNLQKFRPNFDSSNLRKELSISNSDFVMIYIGRLVSFKGFGLVLRTLEKLNKVYNSQRRIKLIVCGRKDKIRDMGLSDVEQKIWDENENIIKVGFVSDVRKYLSIADINFFPSKREGMPVNLMESIASGVPVVTSYSRGCRDVVQHDINGLVLQTWDEHEYAEVIFSLLMRPNKIKDLKDGCLNTRLEYDRNIYFKELKALYATID